MVGSTDCESEVQLITKSLSVVRSFSNTIMHDLTTLTLNIPRGVLRRIYAFYWLTSVETNKHIIFYANNA
jgi:hypothetical protein